jgi:hypothetical protein
MGEYARDAILRLHGVDIEDDREIRSLRKTYPCSCGKPFLSEKARKDHQDSTKHIPSKRQQRETK